MRSRPELRLRWRRPLPGCRSRSHRSLGITTLLRALSPLYPECIYSLMSLLPSLRKPTAADEGRTMKVQEENELYDEINVVPMLDLAYVLLVIFIIMTTASVQGIKVNLPKASN